MSLLLCVFALSISASGVITEATLDVSRSFRDGESIQIGKDLTEMPKTYEAVIYVPDDVTTKGAILSNFYPLGEVGRIDFSISIGGTNQEARPTLDITDQNNNRTKVEFRSDIKLGTWVHVVITHTYDEAVVGDTLSYSVDSYINFMCTGSDEALAELVKAISCYGRSAAAYKLSN